MDYVEAMHLMLQLDQPNDFVIATGQTNSVRYFIEKVCELLKFEIIWKNKRI